MIYYAIQNVEKGFKILNPVYSKFKNIFWVKAILANQMLMEMSHLVQKFAMM